MDKFKIKDDKMYEIKKGEKPKFLKKEQANIAFKKHLKENIKIMKYLEYIDIPNEVNQTTFDRNVRNILKRFEIEDIDFKGWRFYCKWTDIDKKFVRIQRLDKPID